MIVMAETAVFRVFQIAIDQIGASTIYILSTDYESSSITCILVIHLDGKEIAL